MDDEALYRAWTQGDRRAGSRLVDRYVRPIARFFANKVAQGADAEELVAETFEILARTLGTYGGRGPVRAYLFGIAHNVLRNYIRRKRGDSEEIDVESSAVRDLGPSPVTLLALRRQQSLLLEALRALPVALQVVLELAHFEGMSRREIAEALDLPEGTVASRQRKAHELLEGHIRRIEQDRAVVTSTIRELERWASELRDQLGRAGADRRR